jgi:Methyltransferase FkbM domain
MMDQIAQTRSLPRRLLSLLPPLRDWFKEIDRLATDARLWRTVRTGLKTEKIIAAARHIITDSEQAAIIDFLSYLTPRRSVGFSKIRLGCNGDGGYVLLDDFTGVSAALSFGIATECSWDMAIAERGIDVYQYDHTVDGPPTANARFRFFKKKIAAVSSDQTESLGSVFAKLPATTERVILKIDIEGAEWDVLDAATSEELARFSQIVGEFHGFANAADPAWRDTARRVLTKIRSVFDVVHVHGNNFAPFNIIANVAVPSTFELTLVNRAIYECHETDEIFPTALDQPNWADRPDIFLGSMRYR